jgi:hypothetical protein
MAGCFVRSSGWSFYSALLRTHIYGRGDVVMRNGQSVGDECKIREGGCPRQRAAAVYFDQLVME